MSSETVYVDVLPGYSMFTKKGRFWAVKVNGDTVCQSYGTIGKLPRSSCKRYRDPTKQMRKMIREHMANGYKGVPSKFMSVDF